MSMGSWSAAPRATTLQFGSAVVGLEADIDWSDVKGSTTTNCPLGCETKNTWFGTARGRIGYAFDRFLPYFTAGAAFGDVQANTPGFSGTTKTQFSWVLGGGLEYAFMNNWSAKIEYLYTDLDTVQCPAVSLRDRDRHHAQAQHRARRPEL